MGKEIEVRLASRYIIPFAYDKKKLSYDSLASISDSWKIEEKETFEKDIYNYIDESFLTKGNWQSINHKMAIACKYRYIGSMLKDNFRLIFKSKNNFFKFYIREIHLILFQSGIAFLWYSPESCQTFDNIDLAIDFVYCFKELARKEENNYIYREEIFDYREGMNIPEEKILHGRKKYKEIHSFFLATWINEILNSLKCDIVYYPYRKRESGQKLVPDKAIMFHHGIFEKEEDLLYGAYYLTRGYKKTYRISEDVSKNMFKPFNNIYLFATSEGCGYYVNPDEANRTFLCDSNKVMNDYFLLYLLVLYQSYTLLLFSEKITCKLSTNYVDYSQYSVDTLNELDIIITELNVFLAKSIYSSVSYVQHHNEFYRFVSEKLCIKENIDSISVGLEALKNLEIVFEMEEKEKNNRFLDVGITLISILTLVSALNDANDFVFNYFSRLVSVPQPIEVWIINAVVLFVASIVVILCVRFVIMYLINKKRKTKKKF